MSNANTKSFDLAIIGGGIVGLWCAFFAQKAGLKTALYEANDIASGASGGLLGALMPHMPTGWNQKKQFQFDALMDLQALVEMLEGTTGFDCGYRRVGRILPLTHPDHAEQALARDKAAQTHWQTEKTPLHFKLHHEPLFPNWPVKQAMPFGCTFDNLSARVNPRGLTNALVQAIKDKVTIFTHCPVELETPNQIKLANGEQHIAHSTIVTAGLNSFALLKPFASSLAGRPVKGQAAMLGTNLNPELPVIYQNGVYLIVHEDGRTAVGSTSEREFTAPRTTDHLLDDLIERAREICPCVADAPVTEKWANLRMQPIGRDPLLGKIRETENLYLATGGFKISFGIAHRMAEAILAQIQNINGPAIPQTFLIKNRI